MSNCLPYRLKRARPHTRVATIPPTLVIACSDSNVGSVVTTIWLSPILFSRQDVPTRPLCLPEQWGTGSNGRDKQQHRDGGCGRISDAAGRSWSWRRGRIPAAVPDRAPRLRWGLHQLAASQSQGQLHHTRTEAGTAAPVSLWSAGFVLSRKISVSSLYISVYVTHWRVKGTPKNIL